jgi:uncharacterized protein YbbK (DUF523 family)/uncharacterized protein YbgA (DUF1722 family)
MTRARDTLPRRSSAPPRWRCGAPVRVGVSSCLLGAQVRWDGGHKRERLLTDGLAPFIEWVPVCPELELGMGVPREPVSLARAGGELRMLGNRSGEDWTARMRAFAKRRVRTLEAAQLCGYVLKKDSPSCGMERVKVRSRAGRLRRDGRGLFAEALIERMPALPIEEEGRLQDPLLRDNWLERVFAYRRLRSLFHVRWTVAALRAFHAAHELQLRAHSPAAYRALARLLATAKRISRAELRERYERAFMAALARTAPRGRHARVLEHCARQLRERAGASVRAALAAQIADYRAGAVPLIAPVTTLRHLAVQLGIAALTRQTYLAPYPNELMPRSRV